MNKQCGLIGGVLKHSFSKIIHEQLSKTSYELISLESTELEPFITNRDYHGLNVTIPYKQAVMQYCDVIDDQALKINAVNTIVNKDNILYGYNTDYAGLRYLLKHHHIEVKDKRVAILGSGGTSSTAFHVCQDLEATSVVIVSRHPQKDMLSYDQLYDCDVDLLINTTPVGMYPNNDECILDVKKIQGLEAVVDVIYNPLKTNLVLEAQQLGLKAVGGLDMLVAQAVYASELFWDCEYADGTIEDLVALIMNQQRNLVLLGMPSAGKSTIGAMLAQSLGMEFVDTDVEIEKNEKKTIRTLFEQSGEAYFRACEHDVVANVSKGHHQVIATGGGVIKDYRNILKLKQNGVLVFIDREVDALLTDESRPLSKNYAAVRDLYNERYCLYQDYSDVTVHNNKRLEEVVQEIVEVTK